MSPLSARCVYAVLVLLSLLLAPRAVFGQESTNRAAAPRRLAPLIPLYASMVGLQVLDLHSTLAGTRTGAAREANPILAGAAGSPFVMVAIKTGTTAAIVAANEQLWKQHRATSIVVMVAVNSAYPMVTAHNYKVAGRGRSPAGSSPPLDIARTLPAEPVKTGRNSCVPVGKIVALA